MVNPESELYENNPDWVIKQDDRPEIYFRNQLVLDLSNPEVQDFVLALWMVFGGESNIGFYEMGL